MTGFLIMKTIIKALNELRPGCYVDASAQSADYLNKRICKFAEEHGWDGDIPVWPVWLDEDNTDAQSDYSEAINESAEEAVEWLNDQERLPYTCWTVDDNSLFLSVNVDDASDACEFVSSRTQDEPDEGYQGEWLHVNDHGNATLYVRGEDGQDKEIWGVV